MYLEKEKSVQMASAGALFPGTSDHLSGLQKNGKRAH